MRATLLLTVPLLAACAAEPPVLFISRAGNGTTGSEAETERYYRGLQAEPTLQDWLANTSKRCFKTPGATVVEAFYYNGSDLGLGREIACVECPAQDANAGVISCSVSNHGVPQGLDAFAFDFADGTRKERGLDRKPSIQGAFQALEKFVAERKAKNVLNGVGLSIRGATVVFDFDPRLSEAQGRLSMYIYDANDGKLFSAVNRQRQPERLITGLQLDGEGGALNARVKFMRNCLSCHGGKYDERTDRIIGASFLDFDAVLLSYSDDRDPAIGLGAQANFARCRPNLDQFKVLNALVARIAEKTGAIMLQDRIKQNLDPQNNFFLKVNADGSCEPDPQKGYVPAGWPAGVTVARLRSKDASGREITNNISASDFFKVVVHKYCASCHFSQTQGNNLHGKNGAPLTLGDVNQWFKNEHITDLDLLRRTDPAATSADLIRKEVCGASDMPHAEVTRNNMKRDSLAFAYVCNAEVVLR